MPMLENMAAFFNPAEFATTATIAGVAVPVIFEQPYASAFGEALDATAPVCVLPTAAAAVVRGDSIAINGVTYQVDRVEPDGTGLSRLTLYPSA